MTESLQHNANGPISAARKFFVTGTDTEVGKTVASLGLLRALAAEGYLVQGFKPVAAGSSVRDCFGEHKLNDDAWLLQQASSLQLDYDSVNPFLLEQPIAPHIAAADSGVSLSVERCLQGLAQLDEAQQLAIQNADAASAGQLSAKPRALLIEGAGGWRVPLNDTETLADLARHSGAGVVLVVGIRLGCLNHALLTAESIRADGLDLLGWVANTVLAPADREQQRLQRRNIETLQQRLGAPLLAELPWQPDIERLFDVDASRNEGSNEGGSEDSNDSGRDAILQRLASHYKLAPITQRC